MDTIKSLAAEALSHMIEKKRDNGEAFVCFDKDAPEWCSELARHAHGDMLPDDWRYRFLEEVLQTIDDCESDDVEMIRDSMYEIEPDIYTGQLLAWLASSIARLDYVDQYRDDGFNGPTGAAIMGGQMLEKQKVAKLVIDFLESMADE